MPPPGEPIPSSPRNDKRPDPIVAEGFAIHGVRGVVRGHAATGLGILRERLAELWTLGALAQEVHLYRSQLVRAFDTTVGISPMTGLRQMRVQQLGVHQAIKYRSLAAPDAGFPLLTSRVRSVVVAYSIDVVIGDAAPTADLSRRRTHSHVAGRGLIRHLQNGDSGASRNDGIHAEKASVGHAAAG
jgi:AraC-like DNA-binding protein